MPSQAMLDALAETKSIIDTLVANAATAAAGPAATAQDASNVQAVKDFNATLTAPAQTQVDAAADQVAQDAAGGGQLQA